MCVCVACCFAEFFEISLGCIDCLNRQNILSEHTLCVCAFFCLRFAEAFEISPAYTLSKCIMCIRTAGSDRDVRIETIYHQILAGQACGRLP
jgi:hypothetical protein